MRVDRLLLMFFLCLTISTSSALAQVRLTPRSPDALGTQIESVAFNFGVCAGLDRRGIGRPSSARMGELLVGFDNSTQYGDSCHFHAGSIYVGAARFDLRDLRGSLIVDARLNVFSRITDIHPRTRERSFSDTCLMLLQLRTGLTPWRTGEFPRRPVSGDIPSVRLLDRASGPMLLASSFIPRSTSVDVTRTVQAWVSGARSNQGFVFKKRDRSIINRADNNDSCTSYLDLLLYMTVISA